MTSFATIVLYLFLLYLFTGLVFALAFVSFGVTQVQPARVSLGARILFVPAATALWPVVLRRWLKARGTRP
jgi:hypothetical protein